MDRELPKRAEVAYLGTCTNQCGNEKQRRRKDRYPRKLRKKTRLWVTKALSKKEITDSPECQKAIAAEGEALVQAGTWDEDTVCEREKLIEWAKKNSQRIVRGDLLIIRSTKFYERAKKYWKYRQDSL